MQPATLRAQPATLRAHHATLRVQPATLRVHPRIEGIQLRGAKHPSDCKQLREPTELSQALLWFVQGRAQLRQEIVGRLEALQVSST